MKLNNLLITGLLFCSFFQLSYAQKGFMKIGDIDGESSQRGYVNWIVIDAFSNGLEQAQQVSGATRRRGSVEFADIVVTKKADKSTPKLMELCAKGQVVPELEMVLLANDNKALYKVTLNNVRVSSIISKAACTPECEIVDEFSLSYAKITWEFWDSKGEKVMSTFNVATNN
jgi:type VI secretion system secreted protein Hcp